MFTSDRIERPGTKGTEGGESERKQATFIKSTIEPSVNGSINHPYHYHSHQTRPIIIRSLL